LKSRLHDPGHAPFPINLAILNSTHRSLSAHQIWSFYL